MTPLDIAFVSYEYAGVAAGGGIGTYVRNAAAMLAARGHRVAVFTEGERDGSFQEPSGVTVHTVAVAEREAFAEAVAPAVEAAHAERPFDVVEGPEYGADADAVRDRVPGLPLVVKLHTPASVIEGINHLYVPWTAKARFMVGGLRRGRIPRPFWHDDPAQDPERAHTLRADEIAAPSTAILHLLRERWGLPEDRLAHVPNVFVPPPPLLEVPAETDTKRVTFVGKLEVRKGVIDLVDAVPHVLRRVPEARFRLIGRSLPHPGTGEDLAAYLRRRLGRHQASVEFIPAVPYEALPAYYADTDVCAYPSVWENFPNVCLEAMAAARGIVASSAGGMAEMIVDGETGRLVRPRDPRELADAIVDLLADTPRRQTMGRAARVAVRAFAPEHVAPVHEASYRRAIERHAAEQALPEVR